MATLFTIPIPPCTDHQGGAIVCTEPSPAVYLLTFTSPPDNRLTTPFCRAFLAALDVLEFGPHKPGVVITTSGIPKFYSNGLDLKHAVETEGFWPLLYQVWKRLLTYPMPTVALINGHAFAGGLMLATAHDYRLTPSRGFLCLNELLFGAPLKPAMAALFRVKLPPTSFRTLILEAHRFTGAEAVTAGLADAEAPQGLEDALAFVEKKQLKDKPRTGVYGALKLEMYKDLVAVLEGPEMESDERRFEQAPSVESERKEFGRVWYEQWQKDNASKPKL
ncbi:hypothetical protein NLU13_4430 [Sarocladium strictum]|uniref:Enoyl-CoA hydratase/isomerase n=1 Tax=Sarocladium strictum TaxID=5046 RepID=A0AA39GIV8_SARSR|nr:hypothetical protein NLU13_4430 [Sarocladium strictum]